MAWIGKGLFGSLAATTATLLAISGGCGSNNPGIGDADAGYDVSGGFGGDDGSLSIGSMVAPTPTCTAGTGWSCNVNKSCGNHPTTLTGKVYDPAGNNPLYNVVVFIPEDPSQLPAVTTGTKSCNTCDISLGHYVSATTTDATGTFTLPVVPSGAGVPLVVQIGKWRRLLSVNTRDCAVNTAAAGSLRLPAKKSEGDMPQMAILTGGCDDLGCFMRDIGIDASEFTAPHGGGRIDVYQGVGGASLSGGGTAGNCGGRGACPLWASKAALEYYDLALFSCECAENNQTKPAAGMTALRDWLDEGGKVFASHYHYTWFKNSPSADFQGVASWLRSGNASGGGSYALDTSFPKGQTFHDWLAGVGALNANGSITLNNVASSVSTVNSPTNRWIYDSARNPNETKYLSFGTPVGGAPGVTTAEGGPQYCGKAVLTDLHTGGTLTSSVRNVPQGCSAGTLSAQQKALEFLFFDLSACVTDDSKKPPALPPPR